jgi:hypothetical protein
LVLFGFIMLHLSTEGGPPVAYPHLSFADKVGFVQLVQPPDDWAPERSEKCSSTIEPAIQLLTR